jgi:hypothetical protein
MLFKEVCSFLGLRGTIECRQFLLVFIFAILCEHLCALCVTEYRQVRKERESTQRIRKGSWLTTLINLLFQWPLMLLPIDAVYGILLCVVCSFSSQRGTIGCRHSLGEIFVWVAKVELQAI